MGDTVESFGPAPIGDSWEETFEEPAPLRPNFLELRQLNQEKQEREAKRAERRAKLMGGMLQNMSIGAYEPPPVDDRPDSDERKEQESSPTTWYTATDEYGNEYITRHLPVKAGVPQYEWVEPPTGPQHPGVVFVPPTGAQLSARNSPRSLGMNYPMAEAKGGFPGRNTASRS